jgi:CHAT domain-containing protein/tetratricopeptide (TPR) repeat protein
MTAAGAARRLAVCAVLALPLTAAEPALPERIDAAMTSGDFRAARPLAETWLAELRRHPDKKLETARVLHVLGSIRDRLGDHADALRLLEEAASGYEAALAPPEDLAACADEAGRAALAAAEYAAAERWLAKAIAARPAEMASHSRSALAEVLLRTGRTEEARHAWERALTEAGPDPAARCFALRGLGLHAHTTGAWDIAVSKFRAARAVAAAFGPDAPAMTAALDGQIGQSLLRAGRTAEAAPLLESAAAWFETHGGSPDEKAAAWNNLATLWLDNGHTAKAAERIGKLLEAPDAAAFAASPQAITLWLNLAASRQRDGDPAATIALTKAETLAAKHLPAVHPLRIQIALTAATIASDAGDAAAAARQAATASRLAVAWMQQAAAWPDDSRLLEFHATLDPVSPLAALAADDADALASAVLASQGAVPEILLSRRRWEARAGAAAVLAWQRDPNHSSGPPERTVPNVNSLRGSLPADSVFINFVRWRPYKGRGVWDSEGRYGALLISGQKPARWVDLGPAAIIEHRVRRLIAAARDAVAAGEESAGRASIAWQLSSLYGMLWAPLAHALVPSQRVLLRPDALLHFVPWAVLPNPSSLPLCEVFPHLEIVAFPRPLAPSPPARRWRVLAAGVPPSSSLPVFEEPLPFLLSPSLLESLREMPALPGVAAEVAAIRAVAPDSLSVETPEALESAFTASHSTPSVIHFAGHGFACEENGIRGASFLRAGLVMSDCAAGLRDLAAGKPRPSSADGLLFSTDAAALALDGVSAVFLSGCQTGLGHWQTGGQLTGLRHAFLIAGAGAVGSTLWDLNDDAAPELVRAIYTELAAGTPPSTAIWRAQRAWLQSPSAGKLTPGMRAALAGAWIAEAAGWCP